MYEILKKDGRAKRARFQTVHGTIETPVFMNVGTAAAIKGAVSTMDLKEIKTQYVSPACEAGRYGGKKTGRAS